MKTNIKIYLFIIGVLTTLMLLNGFSKPKKVSWEKTYASNDKMPFGLYVFNEEIKTLYKQKLESTDITPYEYFSQQKHAKIKQKNTLLLSVNQYNPFDKNSFNSVLNFVGEGNNLFFASEYIDSYIADKLKIEIEATNNQISDFLLKDKNINNYYIKIKDSTNIQILSKTPSNTSKKFKASFVKIRYKNGFIYVSSNPILFTNYFLLYKNSNTEVESILSKIPYNKAIWLNNTLDNSNIVRYIVSMPALKWAWYLILIGILLFLIFNTKRKQRAIEVVEPLKNESLNFIRTIGDLYFFEKNYKDIIHKKITYFFERLRNDFNITTNTNNERFIHLVSLKLQKDKSDVKELIEASIRNQKGLNQDEKELIKVAKLIDKLDYGK